MAQEVIEKTQGQEDKIKKKKLESLLRKYDKSFLESAISQCQKAGIELEVLHEAFHALKKEKKIGRPKER